MSFIHKITDPITGKVADARELVAAAKTLKDSIEPTIKALKETLEAAERMRDAADAFVGKED